MIRHIFKCLALTLGMAISLGIFNTMLGSKIFNLLELWRADFIQLAVMLWGTIGIILTPLTVWALKSPISIKWVILIWLSLAFCFALSLLFNLEGAGVVGMGGQILLGIIELLAVRFFSRRQVKKNS